MDEFSSVSQRLIIGLGSLGTAIVAGACEQMAKLAGSNRFVCLGLDSDKSIVDGLRLDIYPFSLDEPPRGLRDAGRERFLRELPGIEEWLAGHLEKLIAQGRVYVTLVSSLAGGTGSAVLVDFAYLIHKLAGPGAMLEMEALVPHSARPPRTELGGANAYAALTELNHWMAPDTTYRREDFETDRPPVDRVGLLSCRDLGDSLDREGLPAQLTAYLALSLWPAARGLWAEAQRTFQAFQGKQDLDGNPLVYFSPAAVAMQVPSTTVRNAVLLSTFGAVIEKWRSEAGGGSNIDESSMHKHAEEFLNKHGLVPRQVMIKLGHAAGGAQGFMKSPQVSGTFDALERRSLTGAQLGQVIRELETLILQTIGPSGPDGMLGHSRHHARQIKDHCLAALKEDLKEQSTHAGYAVYVHQLRNLLVDRMESLAREVEKAEAEEARLEQEKDALLRDMTTPEETGLVGRLFGGKKKDVAADIPRLLKQIEEFYSNRLKLEFHRIGTTVFSDVLKEVEKVHTEGAKVTEFLKDVYDLVKMARAKAVEDLGATAHLTQESVATLLAARLGKAEVEQASRILLPDSDELRSVATGKPTEFARSMLADLEQGLGGNLDLDLVDYLGKTQPERVQALEGRAWPVLQPRTHLGGYLPMPPVALVSGTRLKDFNWVAMPGERDGVAILGMRAGFPLRALELSPLHQSYLHELRQTKVSAHTRDDVPWRALERVSAAKLDDFWLTLAQGLQLGHLHPGEPIDSKRWPEMGPVKRCLERFARPEEALYEETHFLIALNYWREEKLEELGVEEFLRLLDPQDMERMLLGESVEPWLARARERLTSQRDDNWPAWKALVSESLDASPFVSEADLVEIPVGFRRWVLSHYAADHPESEMTYNAEMGRLEKAGARATPHQS